MSALIRSSCFNAFVKKHLPTGSISKRSNIWRYPFVVVSGVLSSCLAKASAIGLISGTTGTPTAGSPLQSVLAASL